MKAEIELFGRKYRVDFAEPIDISLPVKKGGVKAWYVSDPVFEPVRSGEFVGSVREGGSVNFRDLSFNPHGHGTHTECVGHIAEEIHSVNDALEEFMFPAQLITVTPEKEGEDRMITRKLIEEKQSGSMSRALIIRTLPNETDKKTADHSDTNPPFIRSDAMEYIVNQNIEHLLIDMPSVDRENDGGKLLSHRIFWKYPNKIRRHATITEMIFVPNSVPDGNYLLNLQIASIENDASPSKPLLYKLRV